MSEWKGTKIDWTLGEEMNRIEGNIQNNHDRIGQNEGNIQGNSNKISQAEESIQGNSGKIDQNKGNIQSNSNSIADLLARAVRWKSGRYTGNGEMDRFIYVGFTPDIVMIVGNTYGYETL